MLKYTSKITGSVQMYLFLLLQYIKLHCIMIYYFDRVNAHDCNINLPKCKLYKRKSAKRKRVIKVLLTF